VEDYRTLNRANWDERVPVHAASADYGVNRFAEDPTFLSHGVRFDLPRLGDIRGLRGVHLQCHIGTDTVSLARLGARMTGLDFSEPAIAQASAFALAAGASPDDATGPAEGQANFVASDVYDAVAVLGTDTFDLVFTGIGALCWLPDVRRWAGVVAGLLKPGGRLFMREGHPLLWSFDDGREDALLVLKYPYFEQPEPLVWTEGGTYVETDVTFTHITTHEWNHGLGEIVTALLEQGMDVTMLQEHESVPWEALPGHMTCDDAGEWSLTDRSVRAPLTYTLQATKRGRVMA
jgi:SAM-dependent methyltransferase